jgi:hypothetical protein
MRAYRGKIEPSSPLAKPAPTPPAPEAPKAPKEPARVVFDNPALTGTRPAMAQSSTAMNLVAIGAIVILAVAAVALLIALVVK